MRPLILSALAVGGLAAGASAQIVHDYEDLTESFLGASYSDDGITYRDVNNVTGFFPDGNPFVQADLGDQVVIENATFFYNDFATYGSPINAMTFGNTYVVGNNLSIGALASVWIDVPLANSASFDIAFYENGPWGGITYHLDAVRNGQVVATDSYVLANGGGRDNATFQTLSVAGAQFDSLHLYAWLNGNYTAPRGMIDDFTVTPVPEPATMAALGLGFAVVARRRRKA